MKKLSLLLLPIALLSCERKYHVRVLVRYQSGLSDTISFNYFSFSEQAIYIDRGDVGVYRNGVFASGARSYKILKP